MFSLRSILLIVITALFTACAPIQQKKTTLSVDPEILWQEHKTLVSQLDTWALRGRTAIKHDGKAWNASLDWRENNQLYHIALTGPFSQGGLRLDGTPDQVVLTLSDGQRLVAQTPESLLAQTVDLALPVSALRDWLRGLPNAGIAYQSVELDGYGRLKTLKQQDWLINYQRYEAYGSLYMPAKILMRHPEIEMRIIVNSWSDIQ